MSKVNAHRKGYKHTPLGWIPEEWEVKELGQLGSFKGGGTPMTLICGMATSLGSPLKI
jgi:hypothetical protein